MERKITNLGNSHVEVLVIVDNETWATAQKKEYDKLAKNVEIKGFRKGAAPESMIKSKINSVQVMDNAINALLPVIYKDIIENDNIKPFAQPKVDVTKLSDTELEVKFVIVTAPSVTLGQYKDLEIGHKEIKVTDEDVKAAINNQLASSATLVVKDGEAKEGDSVVMDFVGDVDGVEFEGGKGTNYELELGSHSFIPGFEEQLVGHKAGEHVDVQVKFPENYAENLKGKDAHFGCDIHEVKEKKLPELTDEFVQELKINGVTTVETFKDSKKKDLLAQAERSEKSEYLNKLIEAIAKNSTISIPEEIIDSQVSSQREDITARMQQSGLTLEQYLSIVGQTEEQFMAKLKEDATKAATSFFVIDEIGKAENIEVTDEDMEFEYAKIADQYGMKIDDVKKALGANIEQFKNNVKMDRIENFLLNNNK